MNFTRDSLAALAFLLFAGSPLSQAHADELLSLKLKDHQFSPTELSVPAGERFRIELENLDETPAEFESSGLKVEKIVVGGSKIVVRVGPLRPGVYPFFDDYHPDQAKGTLTATEPKPQQ